VFAVPKSDVNWKMGGRILRNKEKNVLITNNKGLHSLTLHIVKEEDLGNYTCQASNDLGSTEKTIIVSGKPMKPSKITGNPEGANIYRLRWYVESAFTITEHKFVYKISTKVDDKLHCQKYRDCIHKSIKGKNDTKEFNIQEFMMVLMKNLKPNSKYIVKVQTINTFGRSEWSNPHTFTTSPEFSNLAGWSPFSSSSNPTTIFSLSTFFIVILNLF